MDTLVFSGYLGAFNVILTITNVISKNLPSSCTKWLPIMTYIPDYGHKISRMSIPLVLQNRPIRNLYVLDNGNVFDWPFFLSKNIKIMLESL